MMKFQFAIFGFFLFLVFPIGATAQGKPSKKQATLTVLEIMEVFAVPLKETNTVSFEDLNRKARRVIAKRCNIAFEDDGTNYWVLRTAGANDEVIREIDKCRTSVSSSSVKQTPDQNTYKSQRALIGDLIRFLFDNKDYRSRTMIIVACKEYFQRYGGIGSLENAEPDGLLDWIKAELPRLEQVVSRLKHNAKSTDSLDLSRLPPYY